MVGHNEVQKEREARIDQLRDELKTIQDLYEKMDVEHNTLKIQHGKNLELLERAQNDLNDTVDKLHLTNKVRHETEVKLGEEIDKVKTLQDIVKMKEEILQKRLQEIEELDKKIIDLERSLESAKIQI